MNTNELKDYLKKVVEAEERPNKHYERIDELMEQQSQLGLERDIRPPEKQKAKVSSTAVGAAIWIGLVMSLVFAAIYILITMNNVQNGTYIANGNRGPMFIAITGGATTVISIIASSNISKARNQRRFNKEYEKQYKEYKQELEADELRMEQEIKQKEELQKLISEEEQKMKEADAEIEKLYAQGIIHESYRTYTAVKLFYFYLDTGKAQGLAFDPKTGDAGCYNLFDNDMRMQTMRLIIENMDENIVSLAGLIQMTGEQLDDMHNSMISYYNKSLNYQKKTLESNYRQEAYAAISAFNTSKIRRNTDSMRRDTKRIYSSVDPSRDHWFAGI